MGKIEDGNSAEENITKSEKGIGCTQGKSTLSTHTVRLGDAINTHDPVEWLLASMFGACEHLFRDPVARAPLSAQKRKHESSYKTSPT